MNWIAKHLLKIILLMPMFLPLNACAYSGVPVKGTVLEEGTDKPIPGATIVVRWEGTAFSFADTQSICIHVESTLTDDKGHFRIPAWRASVEPAGVHGLKPLITVYKLGYEEYRPPGYVRTKEFKQNIRYLRPFTGGREERLRKTAGAAVSCGSAGESKKNLLPLYQKLYADAAPLVVTKNDRLIVNGLLRQIDLIVLPYEEVLKRADERNEVLRKEFPNE